MEYIVAALVSIMCIAIGIANRKGNVSMLHSYHRKRVTEEDRIPFGKMVGNGMITIGLTIAVSVGLTYLAEVLEVAALTTVGYVIMALGLIAGTALAFYAMIKYNKGIF